jgi:hypothetical protein
MVLLSVLILTSMSFPAFVRRGALVVFVLFVLNVIPVHIFVVIYRKYDNIIKNLCYGYVFIKCVSPHFNIHSRSCL